MTATGTHHSDHPARKARLRRFLIISLIVHLGIAVTAVVPYVVRQYREQRKAEADRRAREDARRRIEEEARRAAREAARVQIEAALRKDAHDFLIDSIDEERFETIWEQILTGLSDDLAELLDEIESQEFSPSRERLEELMEALRGKELAELIETVNAMSKLDMAERILDSVRQAMPEYNRKVQEALGRQSEDVSRRLDETIRAEKSRRDAATAETAVALRQAADALRQGEQQSRDAARSLTGLTAEDGTETKRDQETFGAASRALAAADESLVQADRALLGAARSANAAAASEAAAGMAEASAAVRAVARTTVADAAKALKRAAETAAGGDAADSSRLAEQAASGAGEAATEMARLAGAVGELTGMLEESAKRFDENAKAAVRGMVAADSAARAEADRFADELLHRDVAEPFRKRAEDLAAALLKEQGLEPDSNFAASVGQAAVETLLSGASPSLRGTGFNTLMTKAASHFQATLPGADALARTDSAAAADAAAGAGERGAQQGSPDAALAAAVTEAASEAARRGLQAAVSSVGQKSLPFPSLQQLAGAGHRGLTMRLKNALENPARDLVAGSRQGAIVDLRHELDEVARARKTSLGRTMLFRGAAADADVYRRSVSEVLEGREGDDFVLRVPDTAQSAAATNALAVRRNASILVPPAPAADTNAPPGERRLSEPGFRTFAYGGAPMAAKPPVIDGDLSEWKDIETFALIGSPDASVWPKPVPPAWEGNRRLMVQWDSRGFYLAYRMVDANDDRWAGADQFWRNDGIELFFDFANKRAETRTDDTQQFWFWPLGSSLDPRIIGGEASPPDRYIPRFERSAAADRPQMAVRRIENPRGYHVELFLPVEVFRKPDLTPGRIMAFNFAINNGQQCDLVWVVNRGKLFSLAPSLWGDLVLLGTDAEVAFVRPNKEDRLEVIVPGEPFGVRVVDADMNIDPRSVDRVQIRLTTDNGDWLEGVLEETGVDSGIFAGSVDTELYMLQGEDRVRDRVLQVAGGERIGLIYADQARRYGERNHEIRVSLPVGLPLVRMGSSGSSE